MFKKIKEALELRATKKSLEVILIDKLTTLLEVEAERQKAEKEAYEKITAMYSNLDVDEVKTALAQITTFFGDKSTKKEVVSAIVDDIKKKK